MCVRVFCKAFLRGFSLYSWAQMKGSKIKGKARAAAKLLKLKETMMCTTLKIFTSLSAIMKWVEMMVVDGYMSI